MKSLDPFFTLFVLLIIVLFLPACESTGGKPSLTLDPINGVCAVSADGKYRACYNPLTKGYSVQAAVPGGIVTSLSYDSASKTYRGTLPDGSAAVYGANGLTIEPPLPSGK